MTHHSCERGGWCKTIGSILSSVLLAMIAVIGIPAVMADIAGPNSPNLVVSNASFGTESWDNPSDAKISNDEYAEVELDDYQNSTYLKATNFSFSLPNNSIIHGIQAEVERSVSSTSSGSIVRDASVRMLKAGTVQGVDRATSTPYTTTDTYESHGNVTDLWGNYWTAADINHPDFGVVFAATKANSAGGDRDVDVDHISITINYSIDNTSPVLTVLGLNPMVIEYGSNYTDAGATAIDDFSGNITGAIMVNGTVNTNALGNYTITYAVNDSVGNTASTTRTVEVIDTTPPVITLIGGDIEVFQDSKYADPGATVWDNLNGDVTSWMTVVNPIYTPTPARYTVRYSVADSSGNSAEAYRTVTVLENEASGLGTREGSHFAPQAQAESSPRTETTSAVTSGTPSTGSEGEATSTTTQSATTETATSSPQESTIEAPRNPIPITGAVVGEGKTGNWRWLAALGIFVVGLLGTAWVERRRLKHLLSSRVRFRE